MGELNTEFGCLNALVKTRLVCMQCNPISILLLCKEQLETTAKRVYLWNLHVCSGQRNRRSVDVRQASILCSHDICYSIMGSCHNGDWMQAYRMDANVLNAVWHPNWKWPQTVQSGQYLEGIGADIPIWPYLIQLTNQIQYLVHTLSVKQQHGDFTRPQKRVWPCETTLDPCRLTPPTVNPEILLRIYSIRNLTTKAGPKADWNVLQIRDTQTHRKCTLTKQLSRKAEAKMNLSIYSLI